MDIIIVNEIAFIIFLVFMGIFDFFKKEIPIYPCIVGFIVFLIFNLIRGENIGSILLGLSVSVIIYLSSLATRGSIGKGDALVYAVIGIKVGLLISIEILIYSLMMSSLAGILLIILFKKNKHYRLAFIPFTVLSYGVVLCLENI